MKIEKLRAKLAKYEAAYRETQKQLREEYQSEMDGLRGLTIERRVRKSKGKSEGNKRRPKPLKPGMFEYTEKGNKFTYRESANKKASGRRPGRPRMTEAQKAAAREMRRQKLAMTSETGSMAAMDDRPPVTNWDRSAEAEARGHA